MKKLCALHEKCKKLSCSDCINYNPTNAQTAAFEEIFESGEGGEACGLGAAVDIGTTTLAFTLYDLTAHKRLALYCRANSQRAWGIDIITRIENAANGHAAALHDCIMNDIRQGIEHILTIAGAELPQLKRIIVAGNTAMLHLLCGENVDGLCRAPFAPVFLEKRTVDLFPGCEMTTLPGMSAFVGADIVAGLLHCMAKNAQNTAAQSSFLLIDLGTNGEIALAHRGKFYTAATAAGPAFEGGNITCGMPAVSGAIWDVSYTNGVFSYKTIGNAPATGICGTGVVALTAALVRGGLVNEAGRLEKIFNNKIELAPGIIFTQDDIRQLQLAKAAIHAGIIILLETAACAESEIENVYIAGGFSTIKGTDAGIIKLLPPNLAKKVQPVGNSSLAGALQVLFSSREGERANAIAAAACDINLAANADFNEKYIQSMNF